MLIAEHADEDLPRSRFANRFKDMRVVLVNRVAEDEDRCGNGCQGSQAVGQVRAAVYPFFLLLVIDFLNPRVTTLA